MRTGYAGGGGFGGGWEVGEGPRTSFLIRAEQALQGPHCPFFLSLPPPGQILGVSQLRGLRRKNCCPMLF